jgi:hypothetical protein
MLALDDNRWNGLKGGYRTRFDPRPLLGQLESERDTETVWQALWDELHHQGDVDEASYASIPHLVRIHRRRGVIDWNTYAMVAIIELARPERKNPELPKWLQEEYFRALGELAEIGASEILRTKEPETARAILSVISIAKGLRTHGRLLVKYSEDELLAIESRE